MFKFFIITILLISISNCSLKKVEKHHGIYNLKKKSDKLQLFQSNTNDTVSEIGVPSTKSTFDSDIWIYMERRFTSSELKTLGKEKLIINNILVLEFDNKGLLVEKQFFSINDMNNMDILTDSTQVLSKKKNFVKTFTKSLIKKINDPLGIKKAR